MPREKSRVLNSVEEGSMYSSSNSELSDSVMDGIIPPFLTRQAGGSKRIEPMVVNSIPCSTEKYTLRSHWTTEFVCKAYHVGTVILLFRRTILQNRNSDSAYWNSDIAYTIIDPKLVM